MGTERRSSPTRKDMSASGSPSQCNVDKDDIGPGSLLPRIYIASETRLFREGLSAILRRERRVDVIGYGSCADALEEVTRLVPDLVVLDVKGQHSFAVARQLRAILPVLRIVAIAVTEMETEVIACAEAGISGYVAQDGTVEHLIETILCALHGEVICSARIAALLFDRVAALSSNNAPSSSSEPLTPREREIALLITRGLQNKDIARRLCLSNATVKNHVHNVLNKLRIGRRSELFGRRFDVDLQLGNNTALPPAGFPNFR
jgi:two-component system nitrate/nitrite response regulator NarL